MVLLRYILSSNIHLCSRVHDPLIHGVILTVANTTLGIQTCLLQGLGVAIFYVLL